jgi:hypothetical protein
MDIVQRKNELFDENFKCKTDNIEDVKEFCDVLTDVTGVQVCTNNGQMYEYLPNAYISAVNANEV